MPFWRTLFWGQLSSGQRVAIVPGVSKCILWCKKGNRGLCQNDCNKKFGKLWIFLSSNKKFAIRKSTIEDITKDSFSQPKRLCKMFVFQSKKPGCSENEFFLKTKYFQLINLEEQFKYLTKLLLKRLDLLITLQFLVHPGFLLCCSGPNLTSSPWKGVFLLPSVAMPFISKVHLALTTSLPSHPPMLIR